MPLGNVPAEVRHIFETVEAAYLKEHTDGSEETKASAAKVAWSSVEKSGWKKNRKGEWTKTRSAKFSEMLDGLIERLEFAAKRKDVSDADKKRAEKEYGDVEYADEKNKKYPLDNEKHVRAAASYFGMPKNRSKYSAADQKKIDAKIAKAEKKFGIGKENKEMSERITTKEFAMVPVKDVPVFKVGQYGKKGNFSESDLDQMVENFNAQSPPAAIIGHTSDYAVESAIPKVGVIGGLKRIGKELVATGVQFADKLVNAIKDGYYGDRSVEIYKDTNGWNFYRLGILGAEAPAVKDLIPLLDAVQMSTRPKEILSFAEEDGLNVLDEIESLAETDTLKNIEEEFATCLSDIEHHLAAGDEPDETKSNCLGALMECYSNIAEEICEHFTFMGKLETMEPEEKEEMMEKITSKLKQLFHFGTQQTINIKESDMDAKQLKEFQEKQSALEAEKAAFEKQKVEFAEREKTVKDAEAKKATDAIKAKVEEFKQGLIAKKYPVKKMEDSSHTTDT